MTDAVVVVAAALSDGEGRVLLQRRPPDKAHGGLWEFPGGKVERGEDPVAALMRELSEELGVNVAADAVEPATFAVASAGDRTVLLLLFHVSRWSGTPQPLAATALAWVRPDAMSTMAMPPADYPLAAHLARG